MAVQNQPTPTQRLQTVPVAFTAGLVVGVADTIRHAAEKVRDLNLQNLENSLKTYGVPSGIEASLLWLTPRILGGGIRDISECINSAGPAFARYVEATRRLLPRAAYIGAALNGIGQFLNPDNYHTTFAPIGNLPVIGGAIGAYQQLPSYAQRLLDGGIEGAGVVLVPWLVMQGGRSGLYGSLARDTGRALRVVGRGYVNINRSLFSHVNNRISALYGNTAGRVAGAGAVLGANLASSGAVYGVGRVVGMW